MKRYWLFIFYTYYPEGGMNDFYDSYDTVEEAVTIIPPFLIDEGRQGEFIMPGKGYEGDDEYCDKWHVFDSIEHKLVAMYDRGFSYFERRKLSELLPCSIQDYKKVMR